MQKLAEWIEKQADISGLCSSSYPDSSGWKTTGGEAPSDTERKAAPEKEEEFPLPVIERQVQREREGEEAPSYFREDPGRSSI